MAIKKTVEDVLVFLTDEGLDPKLDGVKEICLEGFSSLSHAKSGFLTWSKKDKFSSGPLPPCVVIGPNGSSLDGFPGAISVISASNPKAAFFSVLSSFWGKTGTTNIASSSIINGTIEEGVSIGEHCYIGSEVHIGAGTAIEHNVTICCPAEIGAGCIIHSGVVIGADGFGFYFEDGVPQKVEHFGGVVIGDRVEIGANTCIDRGTLDNTIIHDDAKIDNLVHIAHNVEVGSGAMVIAGAVVCGSAHLGDGSYIAPGGIVKNQVTVGNESLVGLGAVLTKNLDDKLVAVGVPAKPVREVRIGDK